MVQLSGPFAFKYFGLYSLVDFYTKSENSCLCVDFIDTTLHVVLKTTLNLRVLIYMYVKWIVAYYDVY